ncbi:MAG: FG-GAP-like repeat-containing protein [Polyangiaceae bacterium]
MLLAAVIGLSAGTWAHAPMAAAAPDPGAWQSPPPLDWPAEEPIVESEGVGYLPGGGTVSAAGDYTYVLPIDAPDGRAGMAPRAALRYSSRAGNGAIGQGWSLDYGGSEIVRCPKTTAIDGRPDSVDYGSTGALCLDGQRLIQVGGPIQMGEGAEYRTERDTFAKIVAHGDSGAGPDSFDVFLKGGRIRTYRFLEAQRVTPPSPSADPAEMPPVDAPATVRPLWVLAKEWDRDGNAMLFEYDVDAEAVAPYSFEHRIRAIRYTAHLDSSGDVVEQPLRSIEMEYSAPGERPDPSFAYVNGVRHTVTRRLVGIRTYAPNPVEQALVARYLLSYDATAEADPNNPRSLLSKVQRFDAKGKALWGRTFESQRAHTPEFSVYDGIASIPDNLITRPLLLDLDGDGKEEMLYAGRVFRTSSGSQAPFDDVIPGGDVWGRPADVDGDGKMEVLSKVGDQLVFTRWDGATQSFVPTSYSFPNKPIDFVDADGDGRIDAFQVGPRYTDDVDWYDEEWYFLHNEGGSFGAPQRVQPFAMPYVVGARKPAALDLNGDGRGELHVDYTPTDPDNPTPLPAECPPNPQGQANLGWHFFAVYLDGQLIRKSTVHAETCPSKHILADLNGDGLKDVVVLDSSPPTVRYNTGAGFLPAVLPGLHVLTNFHPSDFQVADMDGDGRDDILSSREVHADGTPFPDTYLYLRHAAGFEKIDLGAQPYRVPAYDPYPVDAPPPPALQAHSPTIQIGDINGDGLSDLVVFEHDMATHLVSVRVLLQKWQPHDVITRVRDDIGDGLRESVFYEAFPSDTASPAMCAYPQRCPRQGMLTAREHWVHRQDEPASIRRTAYSFEDPRSDVRGRGFLGFGTVRSVDLDSYAATITLYDNVTTDANGRYPLAGLPGDVWRITPILRTAVDADDSVVLPQAGASIAARVEHRRTTYEARKTNNGHTYIVVPQSFQASDWEQHVELSDAGPTLLDDGSETAHRIREGSSTFDDYANELTASAHTVGGQRCETASAYQNLAADWRIGERTQVSVTCNHDGMPLPEARLSTMEYDALGHLSKVTVEPNHPELLRATSFSRDIYGLVWKVTDSVSGEPARITHLAFDAEHVYPRAACNALDQCTRDLIHPAYGVPVLREDINGVRVRFAYDGFGRVREVAPDGGIVSETSYLIPPYEPWGLIVQTTSSDGGETATRIDESGRVLWSARRAFGGEQVFQETHYNLFGQPTQVSRPSVGGGPPLLTETTFDTLGRPVEVVEPNGATTTIAHTMFETTTTDPLGRKQRLSRDVDDRVTSAANRYGVTWVGMTYLYGAFSQVEDVVDPENNVIHAIYDKLGRRLLVDDPDRGTTMWAYNGFGEITSQIDALGDTTAYDRDVLGRVVWASHDVEGVTTFGYDGSQAPGERGRLTSTSSPDGVTVSYDYDALGRSSDTSWNVGNETYSIHRAYDGWSRLSEIHYPEVPNHPRFVARYTYNDAGYAAKVEDATDPGMPKLLWKVETRNADGLLTEGKTGNDFVETRQYDPATGQLTNVEAVKSGDALFAVHYLRDLTGNILSRQDYAGVTPRVETFHYDELDRLDGWGLLYEHQQEATSYGYDLLGNVESVTTSAGVESHVHAGQMLGGVLRLPHALTGRVQGGQQTSYLYDERGRQILGQGREITWKSFDLPSTIHQDGKATTFQYDAFGVRVRKVREAGGKLVDGVDTIAGLYERRWSAAGPTVHVMTVNGTDGPVAQIVYTEAANDTGRTLYLHQEALGSVGLVTDSQGEEVQRTYFDPFGAKVDVHGAVGSPELGDVKLGFTGHRHDDELGLIDMRGRVYDPAQKRFLSPDPHVTGPLFGQSYNRYSYVVNNPLRFTDPTGFDPAAGDLQRGPTPTNADATPDAPVLRPFFDTVWTVIVGKRVEVAKSDEHQHTEPPNGDDEADRKRGLDFYLHMAWGAAREAIQSSSPIFTAGRVIRHNAQVVSTAASLAERGEWDLAAVTALEIPQNVALMPLQMLAAPIEAAVGVASSIDAAMNAADPEERGAAIVSGVQDTATVAVAIAAVAGGSKGAGEGMGPPNPWGKKGGPEHQAKVAEVAEGVKSRGLEPEFEHKVATPGGGKNTRYVDVAGRDANNKVVEMHQIGRQTAAGQPVSREVRAMDDIEQATGKRPDFHPYN